MFSSRLKRVFRGLVALSLVASCSRTEPRAVAVNASEANASEANAPEQAQAAPGGSVSAAEPAANPGAPAPAAAPAAAVTPDTPEEGLPGFDQAWQKLNGTTAEVTVDGKPWDTAGIKVTGNDMWTGFEVLLESGEEKLRIQLLRGAEEGASVTGSDIQVAYTRGRETWLKHGSETAATVTRWREDGPQPVVSLDCTAALRREHGPRKTMQISARVANVFILVDPNTPEYGLEKQRGN